MAQGLGHLAIAAAHLVERPDGLEFGTQAARARAGRWWSRRARRSCPATGWPPKLPLISVAPDKAAEHFGWFANFAAIDCRVSSVKTRAELGWTPTGPGLIEDIEAGYYFK